jgi:small subunit ribosomal protein S6
MRRYETIVIVDADVSENDRVSLFNRIQELIPQQQGVLIKEDLWGVKKLAYEIKKKPRGFYARYDYCGMGPLVDELERFFRIDDRVLKYLTVLLDSDADVEKIQAELEASETGADAGASVDETPAQANDAAPAAQEATAATAATETTESATETSEKE